MSSQNYPKSITTDFTGLTGSSIDSDTLVSEIQASTIITALDFINTDGDTVNIWFKAELSVDDSTTLDTLVAAHTGEENTSEVVEVDIKSAAVELPTITKGFKDLTGYNLFRKGYKFTVTAGEIYEHDISYTNDMMLQGLGFRVDENATTDDTLKVEMVDVDGVVYSIGTVLGQFADTIHCWANREFNCVCTDAKLVPNWVYIRVTYESSGLSDVEVILEHVLRTVPA